MLLHKYNLRCVSSFFMAESEELQPKEWAERRGFWVPYRYCWPKGNWWGTPKNGGNWKACWKAWFWRKICCWRCCCCRKIWCGKKHSSSETPSEQESKITRNVLKEALYGDTLSFFSLEFRVIVWSYCLASGEGEGFERTEKTVQEQCIIE